MATTAARTTIVPRSPPSTPRMCLAPVRAGRAVLDGGWWPRSADPVAEIPGLILALDQRYGPVRQLMLNSHTWDSRPYRLAVGTRAIRLGWFATLDPALAIAFTELDKQLDLLVVPPGTAEVAARRAMARAADPADLARAPDIVTAMSVVPVPAGTDAIWRDTEAGSAWDNEGGRQVDDRPARAVKRRPPAPRVGAMR